MLLNDRNPTCNHALGGSGVSTMMNQPHFLAGLITSKNTSVSQSIGTSPVLRKPLFLASVPSGPRSRAALIKALLLCALLLGLQSCSSNNGAVDPPMFIGFDAPGAGGRADAGTFPQQINESGEIVGWLYDANLIAHAFIRDSSGSITVFDAPGATTKCCSGTFATSVNSAGTVTGYFADDNFVSHGFIRTQGGVITTFDAVAGSSGTAAYSVNDSGVVTGVSYDANTQFAHGFMRANDGTITTFDVPGAIEGQFAGTLPIGINSAGVVIGSFQSTILRGFVRAVDGTITVLDAPGAVPPCNCETHPMGINASGAIVGRALVSGTIHSFLRDANGTFTVFDPPGAVPGDGGSLAVSIDDDGSIVGNFSDSNGAHGYLRDASGNFTTLDFPNPQGMVTLATSVASINSSGAILGSYENNASFATHGFVRE
jgi:predicted membrane protein